MTRVPGTNNQVLHGRIDPPRTNCKNPLPSCSTASRTQLTARPSQLRRVTTAAGEEALSCYDRHLRGSSASVLQQQWELRSTSRDPCSSCRRPPLEAPPTSAATAGSTTVVRMQQRRSAKAATPSASGSNTACRLQQRRQKVGSSAGRPKQQRRSPMAAAHVASGSSAACSNAALGWKQRWPPKIATSVAHGSNAQNR